MPDWQDWRRAPDGPHYRDAAGDHYEIRGTIQAYSQTDARIGAAANGVYRGAVYEQPQGGSPNGFVRVLQIDVETLIEGTASTYGLYQITAQCGYPTERHQRRAASENEWVAWMEFARAEEQVDVYKDAASGVLCTPINPLGMPLSPPLTRPTVLITICFQWLKRFVNLLAAQVYYLPFVSKVNKLPYYGFAKHCLYCPGIIAEESNIPGGETWQSNLFRLTAKLDYRPPIVTLQNRIFGGWDRVQPVMGTHVWKENPSAGPPWVRTPIMVELFNELGKPFTPRKFERVTEPVPIQFDGKKEIPLMDPGGGWDPKLIEYYGWYDLIEEIDFSSMLPVGAKVL